MNVYAVVYRLPGTKKVRGDVIDDYAMAVFLKEQLEKQGCEVFFAALTIPEGVFQ